MTHDYTKKRGVVHTEILLPSHAPPEFQDRSALWNSVEESEKSSNAQLAREIEIALPVGLERQEQINLVRAYVRDNFVAAGMCADFAIHDKGDGNPHAHIMLTIRPLKADGLWRAKCRKKYDLDEHGQRIRLPSGAFKSHRVNTTDWNDPAKAEEWRAAWAEYANRALEQKGLPERIDHRSYASQGVEQIPTVHMGVAATQMERRGLVTEKGSVNREITAQNKLLKEIKARITRLYNWSKEQSKQPGEKRSILEQRRQAQNTAKPTTTYGKVKALKENAAIFNFLIENGISSMQELYEKISAMNSDYYALRGEIVSAERQLANLNERLSMWEQYSENKAVRKRLSCIKPGMRYTFTEKHRAELILFNAAAKYFDVLKASGETIAPQKWRAKFERLTARKDELYLKMKAMREDIKAVEHIHKTADTLAKTEKFKDKEQER
ncbi:conjugal transfer protein TraA [Clostridium sp. W14A]|nr:conjugal transfer protein TraA [Clostridium sp. W14A]